MDFQARGPGFKSHPRHYFPIFLLKFLKIGIICYSLSRTFLWIFESKATQKYDPCQWYSNIRIFRFQGGVCIHLMHKSWSSLKALENMLFMKKGTFFYFHLNRGPRFFILQSSIDFLQSCRNFHSKILRRTKFDFVFTF